MKDAHLKWQKMQICNELNLTFYKNLSRSYITVNARINHANTDWFNFFEKSFSTYEYIALWGTVNV